MRKAIFTLIILVSAFTLFAQQDLSNELVDAVKDGDLIEIKALIEQGADTNCINRVGITPLVMALFQKDSDAVKLLLDNGADPELKSISGVSPIQTARKKRLVKIDLLLTDYLLRQQGAGYTYLTTAVIKGDIDLINKCIELDYDIDTRDSENATAFMYAIFHNELEIAKLLLENGADINAADKDGKTALHIAAAEGNLLATMLLIEKGAKINALTAKKETPLIFAAKYKHLDLVEILIKNGSDLFAKDSSGKSFLDYGDK